jgi:hypothetical protein
LSSHPDIATTSEPWIALHPVYALRDRGIETEYNSGYAIRALHGYLKQSGVDENFYEKQVSEFLISLYRCSMKYQEARFFLDKTPRYYHIIPELMRLFPKAKFILLFRNPLSVLNSILESWVKDEMPRLAEYKDDLMVAPQRMVDCMKRFPDRFIAVKYEELVTEPEKVLKEVCRFLSVTYSNNMINYDDKHSDWEFGDQVGVQKANTPQVESLEKWKKGLLETPQKSLLACSYLDALGAELIEEMGYDYSDMQSKISPCEEALDGDLVSWSDALGVNMHLMEIQKLKAKLDTLRSSLSWRITTPLRWLGEKFKLLNSWWSSKEPDKDQ